MSIPHPKPGETAYLVHYDLDVKCLRCTCCKDPKARYIAYEGGEIVIFAYDWRTMVDMLVMRFDGYIPDWWDEPRGDDSYEEELPYG